MLTQQTVYRQDSTTTYMEDGLPSRIRVQEYEEPNTIRKETYAGKPMPTEDRW